MFKRFLLAFLLLSVASNLTAQNNKYRKLTKPEKDKLGAADQNKLYGDIYTLCFFIDTQFDEWTEEEVEYYLLELESSQYWLADEAARYGVEVNFINDFFQTVEEIIEVPYVRSNNSWQLLDKTMREMSYDNHQQFLDWQQFDLENNKLSVLFFVKDNNRSHARNYRSKKNLDTAVIYAKSTFGRPTTHYTISHELMHLFGAWDLYHGESQTREQAELLLEYFPNSIMINTWRNHENLEVDELTAYLIGWTDEIEEEYLNFKPDRAAVAEEKKRERFDKKAMKFSIKKKESVIIENE